MAKIPQKLVIPPNVAVASTIDNGQVKCKEGSLTAPESYMAIGWLFIGESSFI